MGAEPSRLVKRLPDDRKIRGILLLTGCCVSAFFFLPSFVFFPAPNVFCQFVFSQAVSGGTISAASPCARRHTLRKKAQWHARSHRRQI